MQIGDGIEIAVSEETHHHPLTVRSTAFWVSSTIEHQPQSFGISDVPVDTAYHCAGVFRILAIGIGFVLDEFGGRTILLVVDHGSERCYPCAGPRFGRDADGGSGPGGSRIVCCFQSRSFRSTAYC
jgi:hypothetical protein